MIKLPMYKFQLGEIVKVALSNKGRLYTSKHITGDAIVRGSLFGVVQEQIIRDLGDVLYVVRMPEVGIVVADEHSLEKYEEVSKDRLRTGSIVIIAETQDIGVVTAFWSGSTELETYEVKELGSNGNIGSYHRNELTLLD